MTRGHNIVADGWAGASSPLPHPNLPHTQTYTKSTKNARFSTYKLNDQRTDGRTDGRTDRRTDRRTKPLTELRIRNQIWRINYNDLIEKYGSHGHSDGLFQISIGENDQRRFSSQFQRDFLDVGNGRRMHNLLPHLGGTGKTDLRREHKTRWINRNSVQQPQNWPLQITCLFVCPAN